MAVLHAVLRVQMKELERQEQEMLLRLKNTYEVQDMAVKKLQVFLNDSQKSSPVKNPEERALSLEVMKRNRNGGANSAMKKQSMDAGTTRNSKIASNSPSFHCAYLSRWRKRHALSARGEQRGSF